MLADDYVTVPFQFATAVLPLGLYFILLGLLNSRPRPQLLTGRHDFVLMMAALCPLFVLPILNYVGVTPLSVLLALAAVSFGIWLLAPGKRHWVIYNISQARAASVVARALEAMKLPAEPSEDGLTIRSGRLRVEVGGFSMLQNVSLRMYGCDNKLDEQFERELAQQLGPVRVETSSMAMAMLLVATAMCVAPLMLVAHQAGEIVRILTDLLK